MDATKELSGAARRARERKGLRQEDVAAQLQQMGINISANAYAKFEGGNRAGKFDEVAAIAQVLELDLTAITKSVKRDIVGLIEQQAERNYKASERRLERARHKFTEDAQALSAARDLLRGLAGERVEVSLSAANFAQLTLSRIASDMPGDLVGFFEALGDSGNIREAIESFEAKSEGDLEADGLRIQRGGHDELNAALGEALKRAVPTLVFPDDE